MTRTWTILGVRDVAASTRWHQTLTSPDAAAPWNGLLLFFRVDDFEGALERALRDPDGYSVSISATQPLAA